MGGRPTVSFEGTQLLLVWLEGPGTVRGARIAADGEVLDPG